VSPSPPEANADLVLVGHGSRDPGQGEVLRALRDAVAAELHPRRVVLAWIELDAPLITDVAAEFGTSETAPVVVPLLLSRGTHVARDLPPGARAPLGPDPLLTKILLDRIHGAGIAPGSPLVLAATGSTDPDGTADVQRQAELLQAAWDAPVSIGFVTGSPSVAEALAAASEAASASTPAVVSYFLAPGRLPDSAHADTEHLGSHPGLVALVLSRYRGATPLGVTRMDL
jgi:sirohydrochlorin ferrochelatase